MMKILSLDDMKNTVDNAKHLCLFGVGALITECYDQVVLSLRREPDFFCDNAREKWGAEFFGRKCISPRELSELRDTTTVVITVKNYEGIYEQLNEMGITDVFVCCYDRCYNSIHAIQRLVEHGPTASAEDLSIVSVRDKWTLVTGASRGVGYQIALEMARLGSNIVAHSRSLSHVEKIAKACREHGVQVVPVAAELNDPGDVEAMLSELERLSLPIDIVFNNAAVSPPCTSGIWSVSHQDYVSSFIVNTIASIRICYRLIPPMIQRGFGRVINITSSIQKRPEIMAYACSKAALDKFVHDLAPSLQGTGVMITLADPGWVRTGMTAFEAPHAVESVIPGILLGALLKGDINGRWFGVQDYAGLSIEAAVQKARFVSAASRPNGCA